MRNYTLLSIAETTSTNHCLNELCKTQHIAEFTCVQTPFQTAGRGQQGNSWESERDKNLLFSLVLYPTFIEARQGFILSEIVALSIREELSTYTPDIYIKWPNDIYWQDKKICGILIENILQGKNIDQCIVGCGININQETFRSDAPNPVSLLQITDQETDRQEILDGIMHRIQHYYKLLQEQPQTAQPAIHAAYMDALYRREGFYPFADKNGLFQGQIARIEPDGHLVITEEESGMERTYMFKEVRFVINKRTL